MAYQILPCEQKNGDCEIGTRIHGGAGVPFSDCSPEKLEEIKQYWIKTKGETGGLEFANNARCLDMENFYLSGEPESNSEASLVINFESNPDFYQPKDKDSFKQMI